MSSTENTQADAPLDNSSKSRRTLIGRRLLTILLSLVVSVALVEIAFQRLPDKPWYERIVVEQLPDHGGVILNVAGRRMKTREEPPQTPKPPGTHRIMFLGDSFTFGVGLDDPADTFVSLIGERLKRERPRSDVTRYEVCNAGLPALRTDSWRVLFDVYGGAYDPDLVVAVFSLRDGVRGVATSDLGDRVSTRYLYEATVGAGLPVCLSQTTKMPSQTVLRPRRRLNGRCAVVCA